MNKDGEFYWVGIEMWKDEMVNINAKKSESPTGNEPMIFRTPETHSLLNVLFKE